MTHSPIPASETGRVDSTVYCAACNGTLYLAQDYWRHVADVTAHAGEAG